MKKIKLDDLYKLDNFKVRVNNVKESTDIQKAIFSKNFTWRGFLESQSIKEDKHIGYLYFDNDIDNRVKQLSWSKVENSEAYFNNHKNQEVEVLWNS